MLIVEVEVMKDRKWLTNQGIFFYRRGKFFAIPNINTSGSKRRLELGQKCLSMLSRRIWINSHTYNFVQKTIYPYIRKYYGGYNFSSIFFIWKSVGSIKFRSMMIFFSYFHWHKKGSKQILLLAANKYG